MHSFEVFFAKTLCWLYKGNSYTCNLCGFNSRIMRWRGRNHSVLKIKKVISAGKRRSDCPYCMASDRDRLVWLYISKILSSTGRILHVAPELPLANAIKKSPHFKNVEYECIDKRAKGYFYPNWVKLGDITKLNYHTNYFDLIIANHVLEHVHDLPLALSELKRVLKDNGIAILMVPLSQSHLTDEGCIEDNGRVFCPLSKKVRINRFGQHDHVRLFGIDLETIFQSNGWQVSRWCATDHSLDEQNLNLLNLFPSEKLILAKKNKVST